MKNTLNRLTGSPFILFALLGFLVSLLVSELLLHWIAIFAALYGNPHLGYHNLPPFVHYLQWTLRYLPWILLVIIFVRDMIKQNFTRLSGYGAGFVIAFAVEFVLFMVRFTVTMSEF